MHKPVEYSPNKRLSALYEGGLYSLRIKKKKTQRSLSAIVVLESEL